MEVLPGAWNPDPVYDKKFGKSWKIETLFIDFQVKFHSFFRQNACFLDLFIKNLRKSLNLRPCLWADCRKTTPWRAARSRTAYLWEYPPGLNTDFNSRCLSKFADFSTKFRLLQEDYLHNCSACCWWRNAWKHKRKTYTWNVHRTNQGSLF